MTNWQTKKLGEICDIKTGKWDANHAIENGKYRFYTCAYEYMFCNTKRFSGENLILPGNGVNVGEVFYYKGEFDAYQRTYVINDIKIFPKLLYYHLLCFWKERNLNKQFGAATNFLKIGNFLDYEVYYPESVIEQKRVVKILDEVFEKIEKAKENAEKNLKNSKELSESYLQSVFANPGKDWEEKNIGEICNLMTGGTPRRNKKEFFDNGKVRWLVSGDVNMNEIFDCEGRITELGMKNSNAKYLPVNSVIIALNGQGKTRGTVAMLRIEATCNQSLVGIYPKKNKEIISEYIYFNLKVRYQEIRKITGDDGNDRRGLNMPLIRNIKIPFPKSISEQEKIVSMFKNILEQTKKLEGVYKQKLVDLEELKKSVLNKAFTGEL